MSSLLSFLLKLAKFELRLNDCKNERHKKKNTIESSRREWEINLHLRITLCLCGGCFNSMLIYVPYSPKCNFGQQFSSIFLQGFSLIIHTYVYSCICQSGSLFRHWDSRANLHVPSSCNCRCRLSVAAWAFVLQSYVVSVLSKSTSVFYLNSYFPIHFVKKIVVVVATSGINFVLSLLLLRIVPNGLLYQMNGWLDERMDGWDVLVLNEFWPSVRVITTLDPLLLLLLL